MNEQYFEVLAGVDGREVAIKTGVGAGLSLATWSEIAAFCTAMYFLVSTLLLIPKFWALWSAWRQRRADRRDIKRRERGSASPRLVAMLGGAAATLTIAAGIIMPWESGPSRPLVAYQDIVGVWTICDGITRGVRPGQRATDEQCDQLFYQELKRKEAALNRCGLGALPAYPKAMMLSLAWNNGEQAACSSTAAREMRAGNIESGCQAIGRFVCVSTPEGQGDRDGPCRNARLDKRFVQGLHNRRQHEISVCLKGAP